ncbi:hypothetical protein Syun_018991 [Stephania yunnanensis]|uniref:Uncharacterized protein n=1 Tax=Stephania yunnanensis TaxID=152371 RepID=A0AAP0NWW5_9MAGN
MTAAMVSGSTGEVGEPPLHRHRGRRFAVWRRAIEGIDAKEIANEQRRRLQGGLNSGAHGWTATWLQQQRRREAVTPARRSGGGGAVNEMEQLRGGALSDRSILDETQQYWNFGVVFESVP